MRGNIRRRLIEGLDADPDSSARFGALKISRKPLLKSCVFEEEVSISLEAIKGPYRILVAEFHESVEEFPIEVEYSSHADRVLDVDGCSTLNVGPADNAETRYVDDDYSPTASAPRHCVRHIVIHATVYVSLTLNLCLLKHWERRARKYVIDERAGLDLVLKHLLGLLGPQIGDIERGNAQVFSRTPNAILIQIPVEKIPARRRVETVLNQHLFSKTLQVFETSPAYLGHGILDIGARDFYDEVESDSPRYILKLFVPPLADNPSDHCAD